MSGDSGSLEMFAAGPPGPAGPPGGASHLSKWLAHMAISTCKSGCWPQSLGQATAQRNASAASSFDTENPVIFPKSREKLYSVSHSVMSDSLRPHGLWSTRFLCPWDSPDKNTGVGSHSLLQGIFWTQGSNSGLPHCK